MNANKHICNAQDQKYAGPFKKTNKPLSVCQTLRQSMMRLERLLSSVEVPDYWTRDCEVRDAENRSSPKDRPALVSNNYKAPFTRYNLLWNRLSNRFDNRLYHVNGV